jgi:hypothetical protein
MTYIVPQNHVNHPNPVILYKKGLGLSLPDRHASQDLHDYPDLHDFSCKALQAFGKILFAGIFLGKVSVASVVTY